MTPLDDLVNQLSAEHMEELMVSSVIHPDHVAARGYRTLHGSPEDRAELESLGFSRKNIDRDDAYPLLLIPMHGANGQVRGHQIKPRVPRAKLNSDGVAKPIKYETPGGAPLVVDVPAFTREHLHTTKPLWITEGMKKVDALVSRNCATLGLTGVYNWRDKHASLGDWEDIPLRERTVVVCFDADAATNRNVQQAMARLGKWLVTKGARVKYVVVPSEVEGVKVKGVDDYLSAGGTTEALADGATDSPPGAGPRDASFTDAMLVERAAEDVLVGSYCWAHGLGWLRWTGTRWADVPDVEPLEAVRQWATSRFMEACVEQSRNAADTGAAGKVAGWRATLTKSKLTAIRDLARGVEGVQRDAAQFDANPDLITCQNGTLHLPSGTLRPFSPDDLITKSMDAAYLPGYRHRLWDKALTALPSHLHEWYQDRMGQALTGYATPDHRLVIGQGSGSNGKSTVVSIVRRTFGDYGVMISDRVLMASPDAHPTELMDLRGARYAVLEETPEARHLNVQRLKMTLGTDSIKARRIAKDPVEFLVTHSLFINTNYPPVVSETDHGTWRRLSLLVFPYTFRGPNESLLGPLDRPGDPILTYASKDPEVRAACLAWMAEGARRWYARDQVMLPIPKAVDDDTRKWRSSTDLVLGFSDERLEYGPEFFTPTREMLDAFNDWVQGRGHRPWNDRTFASRFLAHDVATTAHVDNKPRRWEGKVTRGWSGVRLRDENGPWDNEPDPVVDEVVGLVVDETPEPDREYGGCVCGSTAIDPAEHKEHCGFDREEQKRARGETSAPAAETEQREPSAVGFDLETPSWDQLFIGGHDGPFVRLAGLVEDDQPEGVTGTSAEALIDSLESADVIYGHNALGFDLLALAHHHGADYDRLAAKAVDTMVLENLQDPPVAKGMPNGYYGLDATAQRRGHQGKTDDVKALARRHGGFDKIPVNDPEYRAYLMGDLQATRYVYQDQVKDGKLDDYARREMRIVALQNRMTLNGWLVDLPELERRAAHEQAQRDAAIEILRDRYGVPTHRPDKFRLKLKRDWPEEHRGMSITDVRALDGETQEREGFAVRVPGERYDAPWATTAGREAIIRAFGAAGAVTPDGRPAYPTTAPTQANPWGILALGKDALGEGEWYCKDRQRAFPGMLKVFGHLPAVRDLVETILLATGARVKYAEFLNWTAPDGRIHAFVGSAQGSGRWAMTKASITNVGVRGAAAEERAVLVADPGHKLVTVDLSQVDMRGVAALSQDPAYMALFEPGRDAHSEMAVVYFGDASPENRQRTKGINHKFNYGGGVNSTAQQNGLPVALVQQAYDARAEAYPRLMEWTEEVRSAAAAGQLLDNGFGRMMRPDPQRAHTQGPALMGQGCARDIMCESLLRLVDMADAEGMDVRPHLRAVVHDEVVLSVPSEQVEAWQGLMKRAFTWEWRGVPILCDLGTPAVRWSDCK